MKPPTSGTMDAAPRGALQKPGPAAGDGSSRRRLLHAIAEADQPIGPLRQALASLDWDWHGEPLLVLTRKHLLHVIDRRLAGEIDDERLRDWGNALEARDDVAFYPAHEEMLDDVFFCLAVPQINGPLTPERLQELRSVLLQG